jgi:hypothetical protein
MLMNLFYREIPRSESAGSLSGNGNGNFRLWRINESCKAAKWIN